MECLVSLVLIQGVKPNTHVVAGFRIIDTSKEPGMDTSHMLAAMAQSTFCLALTGNDHTRVQIVVILLSFAHHLIASHKNHCAQPECDHISGVVKKQSWIACTPLTLCPRAFKREGGALSNWSMDPSSHEFLSAQVSHEHYFEAGAGWGVRLKMSLLAGCIPVVIADNVDVSPAL